MDMETAVKSLNPWVSIWTKPRETIRWIVDTDPTRHVILLAALTGIAQSLNRAANRNMGDSLTVLALLGIAVFIGPIGGVISIHIMGALLRWSGSLLGGQATSEEVRAAIAWSSVPIIWALLLWIPEYALFRKELFTSATPRIDANPLLALLLLGFALIETIIAIWALVVLMQCVGEVHGFSAWKASGATLILALLVGGVVFACAFGLSLFS
ncbi:MAG: YIP1 family protein [Anaerolineales bacterium]|nr:YIP1 family protein [Anaerolineales bacterium]MCB8952157.1 YIP1 family protein [Ardenticatenales bacterium]